MALFILLAFIIVPIVEIGVFVEVGGALGLWNTLGLVILTAVAGTSLLRSQGMSTLRRVRESLARQVFPMAELFDGLCLLVAGALLLTPGFVTDAVGMALFIPRIRAAMRRAAMRHLMESGAGGVWIDGQDIGDPGPGKPGGQGHGGDVINGEYREIKDDRDEPDGGGRR